MQWIIIHTYDSNHYKSVVSSRGWHIISVSNVQKEFTELVHIATATATERTKKLNFFHCRRHCSVNTITQFHGTHFFEPIHDGNSNDTKNAVTIAVWTSCKVCSHCSGNSNRKLVAIAIAVTCSVNIITWFHDTHFFHCRYNCFHCRCHHEWVLNPFHDDTKLRKKLINIFRCR